MCGLLGSATAWGWSLAVLLCFTLGLVPVPAAHSAEEVILASDLRHIQPFEPGETLTYDISWSNIVTAGIATMTVNEDTLSNGRKVFVFTVKRPLYQPGR
ncbi:MAG: DUF3108 domain-containing protein [Nitrospiraceae bacterium]|nr:DUF3108 domain-containing protein [Nitrospiraceae bacterium]